jgi:hypothetical protein
MLSGSVPKIRRLASDYLLPPLDSELHFTYRISISNVYGKPGVYVLTLDPNSCILDEFGHPIGSTLMANFEFEVGLEHRASKGDESLYEVTSRQRLPARFQLVIANEAHRCPARLLKLDEDEQIAQIVHLRVVELAGCSQQ